MFGGFLGMMVSEHFNNEDCMKTVQCPVFFIHGERDTLIPSNHSKHLLDVLKHQKEYQTGGKVKHIDYSDAIFHKHMTHNDFMLERDIFHPINAFLVSIMPLYSRKNR